jgi:uncharacterized membrane protein
MKNLCICSITVAIVAVVFGHLGTPLRPALAFVFVLLCPGLAWIQNLQLHDVAAELTLSIALSLVLGILITLLLAYTNEWSYQTGLLVLAVLTCLGVATNLLIISQGENRSKKSLSRDTHL